MGEWDKEVHVVQWFLTLWYFFCDGIILSSLSISNFNSAARKVSEKKGREKGGERGRARGSEKGVTNISYRFAMKLWSLSTKWQKGNMSTWGKQHGTTVARTKCACTYSHNCSNLSLRFLMLARHADDHVVWKKETEIAQNWVIVRSYDEKRGGL